MNKNIKCFFRTTVLILMTIVVMLNVLALNVHADPTDIPEETSNEPFIKYYYSNGQDATEDVKDLSKEEIDALLNRWALLYEGKTDENGKIVLPEWLTKGEIKIEETKAPEGYIIEEEETIIDLSNKEVTITNKEKPKLEEPKKEDPKPTPLVPLPKTGIDILRPYYVDIEGPDVNLEGPEGKLFSPDKADFTIKKVDKEGRPLKDAEFKVYGKLEVFVQITITKMHFDTLIQPLNENIPIDDDVPEVHVETGYIEDEINIHVEGIDNEFKIDKVVDPKYHTFSFFVRPGKYRVSETSNIKDGDTVDIDFFKIQSYLVSYEFEIYKDGSIKSIGVPKWQWLTCVYDENLKKRIYVFFDEEQYDDDLKEVYVELNLDNHIYIKNYAYASESQVPEK